MSTLILIAGGSCSGKSTLCSTVQSRMEPECVVIPTDNFYKDLSSFSEEQLLNHNFDMPSAIDESWLCSAAASLSDSMPAELPVYDFSTHTRTSETKIVQPAEFVFIEGLFTLCQQSLLELASLKVFVECAADIRLARRVIRDTSQRGRDVESVINQYLSTVRPMHDKYICPSRTKADCVFSGEGDMERITDELIDKISDLRKSG
ncbi:Uridine kinase [Sedimentisphaera cyanobacteriorum]|uniref:uridine/cytidine kinase n=1 Tax=Sedimentisphaera cyanobacteriorum TaxID=1940790 RepID=A0A1Q2HNY9_9BACT|nr:uridine kinase [Sedimentisphaera cyanobacteriorum]AQQ08945.1 Uridine kinase [Sedimentisphaera cyanobacteriorum]